MRQLIDTYSRRYTLSVMRPSYKLAKVLAKDKGFG
jgi:hypothetical protein